MHRAILEAWIPCLGWLAAAFAGVWLVARISGSRLALSRLRNLHRCEQGSIQTLSFVLTLPIFIMLVLLIVQISQLMIGIAVVHYAAFAAARAAIVWLPAEMPGEPANTVDPYTFVDKGTFPVWLSRSMVFNQIPQDRVWKYRRIWSAAAIACIPIAPSHRYLKASALSANNSHIAESTIALYQAMTTAKGHKAAIPNRLRNKAAYAAEHTWIAISGIDRDNREGPTYNPYPGHTVIEHNVATGIPIPIWVPWKPNEIGWEDPISVGVYFRFPLLPGPGRYLSPATFLSSPLPNPDGRTPDQVSGRIKTWGKNENPGYAQELHFTELTATVTLSNEGLKSVLPYVAHPEPIN